jgi:hypothetical protein
MTRLSQDELANRAFQLAYFLQCEQKAATEIATRALNKLELAASAQGKRLYYRLTGRLRGEAYVRKARSKVSLGEPHLLQRLVYVESEEYERRKEAAAQNPDEGLETSPARQSDLVVHFIKHLVRITTKRNSFYVTLGLSRLLYNYTTPETMELYNLIIQDPDRVHDDYYYRSRKGVLLKEMKERFGALLEVEKGSRGEQRWQPGVENDQHAKLVRECLFWFTPWSTPCVVPERFDPLSDTISQLNFQGPLADEEHEVEVNRLHAALHPECFARLAAASQLADPDDRLELPHFFISDDGEDSNDSSRKPPDLSADDLRTINDLLAQEASRRKAVRATFFRVLVDGAERAEISANQSAVRLRVDEDAELIEVYSEDREGPLLLATHLLNLNGGPEQTSVITVAGKQQISFTSELLRDETGATVGADLIVACRETAALKVALRTVRRMSAPFQKAASARPRAVRWWKPVAGFALLALFSAAAWWLWPRNQQVRQQVVAVAPSPVLALPTEAHKGSPPASLPEKQGPQGQSTPASSPGRTPDHKAVTDRSPQLAENKRKPERDETFVERSIVPDASGDVSAGDSGLRSWNREVMGKPLNELRRVYLQSVSDNATAQELLVQLRSRLASGPLQFSESEGADASLKISVRPASARADEQRVIAVARAVNANGYIIWPVSRRGSSMRYVGRSRYVAEHIVRDLTQAVTAGGRR